MIVFDIETGPQDEEQVLKHLPPFDPDKAVKPLGPFDPDSVRVGNLKPENAKAKIEEARVAHEEAVANREVLIEIERAAYVEKAMKKAALHAITGRVLTVGIYTDQATVQEGATEKAVLEYFWDLYHHSHFDHKFVGHNIDGFDVKFMVKRSWMLGVKVPHDVIDFRGYLHSSFVDTMRLWGFGDRNAYVSLRELADLFLIAVPHERFDHADYHRYWFGDKKHHQLAVDELVDDLEITAAVARRMGVE